MLVLTRKLGEKIQIGPNITITLVDVKSNQIRVGIDAPKEVSIFREELSYLLDRIGADEVDTAIAN